MQNHVENHGLPTMLMDNFADNTLDQIGLSVQSDWQFGEACTVSEFHSQGNLFMLHLRACEFLPSAVPVELCVPADDPDVA